MLRMLKNEQGARTFEYATASLRNSLSAKIRANTNIETYKSISKNHLLNLACDFLSKLLIVKYIE